MAHSSCSASVARFLCTVPLMLGVLLVASCAPGGNTPTAPAQTSLSPAPQAAARTGSLPAAAQPKIEICHRSEGSEAFMPLSVAAPAVEAHLAHGDALVGSPVPGQPALVFIAGCTTAAAGPVTIGFSGLLVPGAPVTTYTESGFTVVPTAANWVMSGYGAPGPAIIFQMSPIGVETTGQIRVTAGGGEFKFVSVDVYSSVTPIPYVFTGLKDSVTVFSVTGTQPNTFGNFATVMSPQAGALIDTLIISLTNTPPVSGCCGTNPMGLDNIVLLR